MRQQETILLMIIHKVGVREEQFRCTGIPVEIEVLFSLFVLSEHLNIESTIHATEFKIHGCTKGKKKVGVEEN